MLRSTTKSNSGQTYMSIKKTTFIRIRSPILKCAAEWALNLGLGTKKYFQRILAVFLRKGEGIRKTFVTAA